jgi:DNA-binding response OmpR family regulator
MDMRILIVEDERRLARTLGDLMETQNYTVDLCYDGIEGMDNALSGIYDAVILDVMLPGKTGFEIVRAMRDEGLKTPVLLLTARTELDDRVHGLDAGADYYLTKPFQTQELLACIRAITRRQTSAQDNALRFGDLKLELDSCQLCCGGKSLRLSRKEFDILSKLLASSGAVVTKEAILLSVWGYDSSAEDNNVEVYISLLRRKLHHLGSRVTIKTLRMLGYQLEEGTGT